MYCIYNRLKYNIMQGSPFSQAGSAMHLAAEEFLALVDGMFMLFSPWSLWSSFSSQHDALTILVDLITHFGSVLGLSDRTSSNLSKKGDFLPGVPFPVLLVSRLHCR